MVKLVFDARKFDAPALPAKYAELSTGQRRKLREQYVLDQKGLCYHCKGDLTVPPCEEIQSKPIRWELFPPGFEKNPVHLHHSHETGMTLGAVHARCNAVLWQYEGE